jgi:DNA polymerase III alpha subunit (gram-positive type)
LVAHNAPFDINILRNEEVLTSHYIDTLRVAQHLIESEQHNLQYLRYFLNLELKEPITPHDALGDILVLEALYYYLENLVKEKFSLTTPEEIIKQMMELTETPILIKTFAFGKYVGKTFAEIAVQDKGYLQWLVNNETSKPELEQNQNLVYTLKFYLD